jgi:hypothetical protein
MNHTSQKPHLTHFDTFSTRFRHVFNSFSPFSTNLWFSSFSPQKIANYLSRVRRAVTSRRRPCFPNQIQREFLFNDAIPTHSAFPASSHPRQKTNLLKLGLLSLRAADTAAALVLSTLPCLYGDAVVLCF